MPDEFVYEGEAYPVLKKAFILEQEPCREVRDSTPAREFCERGYVAQFEVHGTWLYLQRLRKCYEDAPYVSMDDLFPDSPQGVRAVWYSGAFDVGLGARMHPRDSQFEATLHLAVEEGRVVSIVREPHWAPDGFCATRVSPAIWLDLPADLKPCSVEKTCFQGTDLRIEVDVAQMRRPPGERRLRRSNAKVIGPMVCGTSCFRATAESAVGLAWVGATRVVVSMEGSRSDLVVRPIVRSALE
ncbi:MAG: hypothetical protein H6737_00310 [Alphaproteobacteria bacterium]|nr:hypothetical protein [Alphaproteobacteria bacterium]